MYSIRLAAISALAMGVLVLLIGGSFAQSGYAVPINAQVKAVQNGVGIDTNTQGVLGEDIDCVGGLSTTEFDEMICYLVPDGVATPDYKTGAIADQTANSQISCPTGVGFGASDACMSTTFDDSLFSPGHWRFVAEFYNEGELVDTAGIDYGVHSFFVIPESPLGIAALVGSSLAALAGYSFLRSRKGTQISSGI